MNFKLPDTIRQVVNKSDMQALSQKVGYQIAQYKVPEVWMETRGEGVTVAVLDTGAQVDHEDLAGAFSTTRNCVNIRNINNDVTDKDCHGTHVCGIIGARDNVVGIVGVAPSCNLVMIKVLGDNGNGSFDSIIRGIDLAIELKVDVINMSLGAPSGDPQLQAACKRAYDANIVICCASGNRGTQVLDFPAQYKETISVGALDSRNTKAVFSQYGSGLDFMAPGVEILSTIPTNSYMLMSGTSMATPWLSGIVALLISKHKKQQGKTPINSVEDVREHLRRMAVGVEEVGTGFGLVDVVKMRDEFVAALSLDERFVALRDRVGFLEEKLKSLGEIV